MLGHSKTTPAQSQLQTQRFRRYLLAGVIAVAVFASFRNILNPESSKSSPSSTNTEPSEGPGLSRWISETGSGIASSSQLTFRRDGLNWKLQLWHLKNVCITSRHQGEAYVELLFLSGTESPPPAMQELYDHAFAYLSPTHNENKLFNVTWMPHPTFAPTYRHLALADYKGNVTWMKGHTMLITKREQFNHPAAWMRYLVAIQSSMSAFRNVFLAAGVTASNFLDGLYMMEEEARPNGWVQFVLQTVLTASRNSLAKGNSGTNWLSFTTLHSGSSPHWVIGSLAKPKEQHMTCFESLWRTRGTDGYWSDTAYAEAFRIEAMRSVGRPNVRPVLCKSVKAVILLRNRPFWNHREVFDALEARGLLANYAETTEDMPYGEQVSIWAEADIVISVHGSHLNNQVFLQPGSYLIEIFPANFYVNEEKMLALSANINYIALKDNDYPTASTVQSQLSKEEAGIVLDSLEQAKTLKAEYLTSESCTQDKPCRQAHRNLGAMVDMKQFSNALDQAVAGLKSMCTSA